MKYHPAVWDQLTRASGVDITVNDAAAVFALGDVHIDVSKMRPRQRRRDFKGRVHGTHEATHWSLLAKAASGQIALTDMQKHRQQAAAAAAPKSK